MMDFLDSVVSIDEFEKETLKAVSKNRRILLPFGAVTLQEVLRRMKPEKIVFSALGVREGFLYSLLDEEAAKADPLIEGARELSILRARSPAHAQELADWTGKMFPVFGVKENANGKRYRIAACLLADISWRAHPDYRGLQALNIISNGAFLSVSHPGRAYIALTTYYRYEGLRDSGVSKNLAEIATDKYIFRSKLLGAILRVLYLFSASMSGLIPKIKFERVDGDDEYDFYLIVPEDLRDFVGERLAGRLGHLEKLLDKKIFVKIGE
jgi:exopolyphosphatase/guanosine-5'-triphosphate,3'-diphosphate pyrophosphatase